MINTQQFVQKAKKKHFNFNVHLGRFHGSIANSQTRAELELEPIKIALKHICTVHIHTLDVTQTQRQNVSKLNAPMR